MMLCRVYELGLVEYSEACRLQKSLLARRLEGDTGDTLLLLEHPPTITVGRAGKLENILATQSELAEKGVTVFFTDRGGDVTYHGPGQLVGYPIIDLRERSRDIHSYLHNLEEVLIRTLADFSVKAGRDKTHSGVWVGNKEIAAIGIKVKRWVTMHGFALNVNVDLEPFSLINPCGFCDRKAASLSALTSQYVPRTAVTERLLSHFSEVFDARLVTEDDSKSGQYRLLGTGGKPG